MKPVAQVQWCLVRGCMSVPRRGERHGDRMKRRVVGWSARLTFLCSPNVGISESYGRAMDIIYKADNSTRCAEWVDAYSGTVENTITVQTIHARLIQCDAARHDNPNFFQIFRL